MNPVLAKLFGEHARGNSAKIPWETFIDACLYDAEFGYYRKDKLRVGGDGADFYTSASLKERVFSELVFESAKSLLAERGADIAGFEFYEIGAEPNTRIIENSKVARLGDPIEIPPNAVVISNELLDARPFSRFRFGGGKWRKGFAEIEKSGDGFGVCEIFGEADAAETAMLEKYFPRAKVEGFRIDASFDALELFEKICAQTRRGAIIFADYFRTAAELSELPFGTARGYFKHADFADIARNAGDADITFSPCSDMLADIAGKCGFCGISTETQESFFMRRARGKIREIAESPNPLDFRKRELAQLLSPVHMGAAFRVFSAVKL